MSRKQFDIAVSSAGLALAIVLVVVGALLIYGSSFVGNQVHSQLAAQKIFFPAKGSPAIAGPQFAAMRKYAGEQLTTGPQAETYANHFIAVHLREVAGGKTYSQVSAESLAHPGNTTLKSEAQTLFQGTTLRGLLLNAYAFGTVGQIAEIAAIVCFVGAAVFAVLAGFGYRHASRQGRREQAVPGEVEQRAA
jgi:hypothetical protein